MKKLILTSSALPQGRLELLPTHLPLVMGRSRRADICIADGLLSRRHSELRLTDDGSFEVVDLDSTNLTIVNDHDISRHVLKSGDRILLGDTEFVVDVQLPDEGLHEKTTREISISPPPENE